MYVALAYPLTLLLTAATRTHDTDGPDLARRSQTARCGGPDVHALTRGSLCAGTRALGCYGSARAPFGKHGRPLVARGLYTLDPALLCQTNVHGRIALSVSGGLEIRQMDAFTVGPLGGAAEVGLIKANVREGHAERHLAPSDFRYRVSGIERDQQGIHVD